MLDHFVVYLLVLSITGQVDLRRSSPHGPETPACDKCHVASSWEVSPLNIAFKHNETEFPLVGRHASVTCRQCHTDLLFSGIGTDCVSCHADVHQGQFNIGCARCHSPYGWRDPDLMRLLHNETRFPLLADHALASCEQCHPSGKFKNTPIDCIVCHRGEWEATTTPAHNTVGFPTNCSFCHTEAGWNGAFFDHRQTAFPLVGQHRHLDCSGCHTENNYRSASTICYDCHSADYDRATNPNHRTLAFPLDCSRCHTPNGWQGKYAHTFFPIYAGSHNNTWRSCTECHPNPSNYAQFTCLTCHDRSGTDREHREERGYSYDSNACLNCHPDGKAEDD